MPVNAIDAGSAATGLAALQGRDTKRSDNVLGRDHFLQLLLAQMRFQDPLDPIKDAEFVAQLAQFSTLESIEKLNESFTDLLLIQQLTQGANLVGRTIVFQRPGSATPEEGVVDRISIENGKLQLFVGDTPVSLDQVRGLEA
jgi:flagellar basal-body rod modification protein FlgD